MAPTDELSDLELLERHAPIVRFNEGEYFLPASVEAFVGRAELWERTGPSQRTLVAAAGTLDIDRLVDATRGRRAEHFLRLVSSPMSQTDLVGWRMRRDRPRFRAETRLGRVGVLARLVDAGARFSLLLRGRVPAGAEAAAAVLQRDRPDHGDHPYYGRVVRGAGYVVAQYWYFYFFNDWRSRAHGVNDHEGDWEQVTIFLVERNGEAVPAWLAYSAHEAAGADLRRRWDDPDLTLVDGHPVVHAGLGSHAGAFLAGEYLTVVRGTRLSGVARAGRRISRLFLPWTRDRDDDGVGIPYIDYKRGDGESIGAGQPWRWRPVVVDDDTPWVREYTGLWGDDTEDRFGGERGPAGPRYERDGTVRRSWADPVGWAALDGVAPDEEGRRDIVSGRITELTDELDELERERDRHRRRLRATTIAGSTGAAAGTRAAALAAGTDDEHALVALAVRTVVAEDERRRLEQVSLDPPPAAAPHAHLRHRPLPLPAESGGRRRVLRVWATISTPLLFVLLALVVGTPAASTVLVGGIGLLVVFAVEAAARGRLLEFLLGTVALVAVGVVVGVVVLGLLASWRLTLVVLFLVAAGAFLVVNLRELVRS